MSSAKKIEALNAALKKSEAALEVSGAGKRKCRGGDNWVVVMVGGVTWWWTDDCV